MQTRKVYNLAQRPSVFQINTEVNRLAEELTDFSVESITYDGAGGLALFYSYTIDEEDSWSDDGYDDDESEFPGVFIPAPHQRHSSNYSWD